MTVRILLQGDCRSVLASLPDASVHCVVSSPPYYGLREYGTATWEGGDPACDHVIGAIRTGLGMAALGEQYRGGGKKAAEPKPLYAKAECPKCGALRFDQQIGLEETPAEYVAALVADRLQRHAIGIELNRAYCEMARRRIERDAGLFADLAAD